MAGVERIIKEGRPGLEIISGISLETALTVLCGQEICRHYINLFKQIQERVEVSSPLSCSVFGQNGSIHGVIVGLGNGEVLVSVTKGKFAVRETGRDCHSFYSSLAIPDPKMESSSKTKTDFFVIASTKSAIFLQVREMQTGNGNRRKKVIIDGGKFP